MVERLRNCNSSVIRFLSGDIPATSFVAGYLSTHMRRAARQLVLRLLQTETLQVFTQHGHVFGRRVAATLERLTLQAAVETGCELVAASDASRSLGREWPSLTLEVHMDCDGSDEEVEISTS